MSPDAAAQPSLAEAGRVLTVCNACRYCEGYCAVFPAMERRLDFSSRDLVYLANLCHDCRECYYSCQYAPPHEFALNLPRTLAGLRRETWRRYARPRFMLRIFGDNHAALIAAIIVLPLLFLLAVAAAHGTGAVFHAWPDTQGAFYRLLSHTVMIRVFGFAALFAVAALALAARRFRREIPAASEHSRGTGRALADSLTLRYLGGGGTGCAYPHERASTLRRRFHHLMFYGFLLCFAATVAATVYHYLLGRTAPYDVFSIPVILGTTGGLGLLAGPGGLLYLKAVRDPEPADAGQTGMDIAFLLLLFLTGLSGLLLLLFRETAAMGMLLILHLGLVLGLFLSLPYGKFVHALYRYAALRHFAEEEARK